MNQVSIENIQKEISKIILESLHMIFDDLVLKHKFVLAKSNLQQIYWMDNDLYEFISYDYEDDMLFDQKTECINKLSEKDDSKILKPILDEFEKCLTKVSSALKVQENLYIQENINLNALLKKKGRKLQDQENKLPNIINSINIYEKFVQGLITQEIEQKIKLFLRKIQRTFNKQDISSNPFLVYLSLPSYLRNEKVQTKKFIKLRQENKIEFDNKEDLEKFVKFFSDILSFNLVTLVKEIEDNYNKQMVELAEKIHKEFLALNFKMDMDEISFPTIEVNKSFKELIVNVFNNTIKENQVIGYLATTSIFGISFGSDEVSSKVSHQITASKLKEDIEMKLQLYKTSLLDEMRETYDREIRKKIIKQKLDFYSQQFKEYKKQETTKIKNIYNKEVKEIEETIASSQILQKRNKKLIQRVQVAQKLLSDRGEKNV